MNTPKADLGRHAVLLIALLLLLMVLPLFAPSPFGVPRFRLLVTAVLVAGVYSVSRHRRILITALSLSLPALVADWVAHFTGFAGAVTANLVLSAAFMGFVAAAILVSVLQQDRVTTDTILGGICVYLLIGMTFVLLFSLVEFSRAGSFLVNGQELAKLFPDVRERFPTLIYFSFVTLTTLGYGDVQPAGEFAQMLCAGEAVVGQLYLTILVARLVGLHISHARFGN
ncbi:MAG: potassium channel family protein [Myxococcota bacterium]